MPHTSEHEQLARAYLQEQLGAQAPTRLTRVAYFDEEVLEGESDMTLFTFRAALGGNPEEDYYVVTGQTEPNYYPAAGLSPDEVYSVHLGTRFMLVLEVSRLPPEQVPPSMNRDVVTTLRGALPPVEIGEFQPAAAFKVHDQIHLVGRITIGGEEVYAVGGDLPVGLNRRTDLPPHLVYRLHLGNVIRQESPGAQPEAASD